MTELFMQIVCVISIIAGYFLLWQINVKIMAAITLILTPLFYLISERHYKLVAVLEYVLERIGQ
jgi:hypothetical protein